MGIVKKNNAQVYEHIIYNGLSTGQNDDMWRMVHKIEPAVILMIL